MKERTNPEENGVREVGGEMGEDLIHMLGSFTPGGPEVEYNGSTLANHVIQLFL